VTTARRPAILVLNAGSSSLKFSLYEAPGGAASPLLVYDGAVEGIGGTPRLVVRDARGQRLAEAPIAAPPGNGAAHEAALAAVLGWTEGHLAGLALVAAGHRVVHGGAAFTAPVRADARVIDALERLAPLAPLHQPHNVAAMRALARIRPGLAQVACFDTAFHQTQPPLATAFALPREITEGGVRRYGFHGLSYEYIAEVLPRFAADDAGGRVVVAHLGNGASMCALRGGRSVATTMGLTALDGLPMGTRAGSLDPGVLLYLMSERGMDVDALTDLLYHRSGLLGVSGVSGDMRELLRSRQPSAAAAIDLFVYRIGRELGSLAAALGGLDALVFTAGIGENASPVRARVCAGASWLGVRIDEDANRRHGPRISSPDSAVSVWVIPTDEELTIARHTSRLLEGRHPANG
jgi:acetate kinase